MTDFELEERLHQLVHKERKITQEILELIREAEKRKLYLDRGYPNLYEWLVRGFGFSQAAAYRRVQAARLIRDVPEVQQKMARGELSLTTVVQLQSMVQKEERRIGEKFDAGVKRNLVTQLERKPPEVAAKILNSYFPEIKVRKESLRSVAQEHSRLTVTLEDGIAEDLKSVRALLSNSCMSWSEVVSWLVKDYLKRRDPMRKK